MDGSGPVMGSPTLQIQMYERKSHYGAESVTLSVGSPAIQKHSSARDLAIFAGTGNPRCLLATSLAAMEISK